MNYENKVICKECGGKCCLRCGCTYMVSDFPILNKEVVHNLLNTQRVSISSSQFLLESINKDYKFHYILQLRARNIDRGEIDLFSFTNTCASLTSNGCYFDLKNRPGCGVHLIPDKDDCYVDYDSNEELFKWFNYQNMLKEVIYERTGMTSDEVIKEDIIKAYYDILNDNYECLSKANAEDMMSMLCYLKDIYPECLDEAYKRKRKK